MIIRGAIYMQHEERTFSLIMYTISTASFPPKILRLHLQAEPWRRKIVAREANVHFLMSMYIVER